MTSLINPSNIDITYPIAGQDNDSQGFRDNFKNIQTGLDTARSEITILQSDLTAAIADIAVKGIETLQYEVPSAGEIITITSGTSVLIVNPVSTIATATIIFPSSPVNGQTLAITFGAPVTALTVTSTETINGPITSGTSNSYAKWVYSTIGTTWFRIG
jgi:hypothetical protein